MKYSVISITLNHLIVTIAVLTGMQLEQQLDCKVVEGATVLDYLDEWSQATLS